MNTITTSFNTQLEVGDMVRINNEDKYIISEITSTTEFILVRNTWYSKLVYWTKRIIQKIRKYYE